jgi:hypothetical protein
MELRSVVTCTTALRTTSPSRQRFSLLMGGTDDAHHIAYVGPILFIVRVNFLLVDDSLIQRMRGRAASRPQ